MTEIQTPALVKPTQEARSQASLWHRLGEHLNGFRQEAVMGLGCISAAAVFAMILGKQEKALASPYMAGDTPANISGAVGIESFSLSRQEAKPELMGPQVYLVCAYPSDVETCDINDVKKIGENMQTWIGNPQKGAADWSIRLNPNVIPLRLGANTSEVITKARISDQDANSPGNLYDFLKTQVHEKVTNHTLSNEYIVALSNVANLDQNARACSPGHVLNGMNTPGGRNIVAIYKTPDCNREYYLSVLATQRFFRNEGFLSLCHPDSIKTGDQRGFSTGFNNLLNPDITNSWKNVKISDWLRSTSDCPGADSNTRTAWKLNALTTSGKGSFQYFVKDGAGNWAPRPLDPGSRVQAGVLHKAQYVPASGEVVESISGCEPETVNSCTFTAKDVINILVRTKSTTTKEKYTLIADAVNGKLKLGRKVGERMLYGAAKEHIVYTTTIKGERVVLIPKADAGYRVYKFYGCENPNPEDTKSCTKYVNHKNPNGGTKYDYARVTFTKIIPKPEK